jgi:UDP-3-O-[3-hydroxymyristoyl] N-acetylglucosamine deacetylase/3-hydroxyacyl-[acyl-carrier-protein] dehydratase
MADKQKTIKEAVSVTGTGLHTGQEGTITFHPAPENHGIKFRRIDLEDQPVVDATIDYVVSTDRGTTLGKDNARIYTIEHVLAALTGMGIDNTLIDIDMEEIPIKDGSSSYFIKAIEEAGIQEQNAEKKVLVITEKTEFELTDKKIKVSIEPADHFSVSVEIDYETKVLGKQHAELNNLKDFKKEISSCRTFVFLHELEYLLNNNLIKGGDINNAIIFVNKVVEQDELDRLAKLFNKPSVIVKSKGILNNIDLYFDNEPARHKLLDLIGDLTLLGMSIQGHVKAQRPGHYTNTQFTKLLQKSYSL